MQLIVGMAPTGNPCTASCGSLNARAAVIGVRSLDRFRCCLEKTGSPGAPGSQGKMSPAFERKSAMVARLQAFSRLVRFLDTKRICPAGGDYPYHQVTEADIWSDDPRSPNYNRHIVIDPKNPPDNYTHEKMRWAISLITGSLDSHEFRSTCVRRKGRRFFS